MESNRSSSRLKERLARMFRPVGLLRSSCSPSTPSAAVAACGPDMSSGNTSSQTLPADVAHEPVFVRSRRLSHTADDADFDSLCRRTRSFSTANGLRRHPAEPPVTARFSLDCGGCRPNRLSGGKARSPLPRIVAAKSYTKKERRVKDTGGFYKPGEGGGRTRPPVSPSSPSMSSYYYNRYHHHHHGLHGEELHDAKQSNKKSRKKLMTNNYGFGSSSSLDSDGGCGFFSSDEAAAAAATREETEAFFSSRSFSSDSSEFYKRKHAKTNARNREKKSKPPMQRRRPRRRPASCNGCNVKEGFRPLVSMASAAAGAATARRGLAVVKQSSDPYADFRTSMVEMIIERQIFGAEELERLLQSYLSLNSPRHHPLILQAFSDIWVVLYGG